MAELFISYGFDEFNYRHPQTGRTPLATAITRSDFPGMFEYAKLLIQHGADLCHNDPEDTNPLALAKRIEEPETRAAFTRLFN